ncbi:MAG: hypothetical protein HOA00_00665, partial [Rhodospirillaceae bacterium]|nr:hypothetical protein [Rhodospirillaceae bacterium]
QNEDTDRAWLDLNNYPEDGLDIDLMITAIGEIRSQDTSNGNQGGFGVGNSYGTSGSFIDTVANPTGAEAEVETLTFHFEQRWNRLRIGFSRFGQEPNGGLDQAQIQLCDGGVDGECETLPTVTACPTADTNNNWRGDAFYTTGLSNLLFDTVIVTPQPNSLVAGDQQSDFYVRTLKACDAVGACTDLVYGDNSSQAARYCDLLNP